MCCHPKCKLKVSILGAGHGGFALAFHLVQLGHEVLLFSTEDHKHSIESVLKCGYINALEEYDNSKGKLHGLSKIRKATTDIKEAMEFSNIIMLVIPSFGQGAVFQSALPYLTSSHIFITLPGNFAFLDYIKVIQKYSQLDISKKLPFTLVETSTIPYACRKTGENNVFISGVKRMMHVGVYPSSITRDTIEYIKPLFALKLLTAKNVIQPPLCNMNITLHPAIMLQNAGWVEATKGDFLFYKQGASPAVLRLIDVLDKERTAVGRALGFEMNDLLTTWQEWYGGNDSATLEEFLEKATCYDGIKAPSSLDNRYITEDIGYLLAPMVSCLAKICNVQTPVGQAVLTTAHALTGLSVEPARDFAEFPLELSEI